MFSACSAFILKACCNTTENKSRVTCEVDKPLMVDELDMGEMKTEVIYELNKPLKAIVFNHTVYDKETLTPRSAEAGQQLVECLRDDLKVTDIDHKLNLNKLQVINCLIECNFL